MRSQDGRVSLESRPPLRVSSQKRGGAGSHGVGLPLLGPATWRVFAEGARQRKTEGAELNDVPESQRWP